MNEFLLLWISLSLSGALVTAALFLLNPVLRRFGKTWQYYLWMLVILRFLIPVSPDISIMGRVFQQAETHFTAVSPLIGEAPEQSDSYDVPHGKDSTAPVTAFSSDVYIDWKDHIWGVLWLMVSIALLCRKIYGYQQLVKIVRKESQPVADLEVLSALEAVSTEMRIKQYIPVYSNSLLRAPMLTGVLRPAVVIPAKVLPHSELMYIFRHELTHYRRMDVIYKWLTETAVCLHWFNPMAYWVRKQISRDCEFSCDEAVTAGLSEAERRTYGNTLLHSIELNHVNKLKAVTLSLSGDGLLIRERLVAIMQYRYKSKKILLSAALLTSILLCGTLYAGAYTVTASESKQADVAADPIQIKNNEIASGGKISLSSQKLASGTECRILFTWKGPDELTVICSSPDGTEKQYAVKNGTAAAFRITAGDEYTISVHNTNIDKVSNVNGSIQFHQNSEAYPLPNAAPKQTQDVSSPQRIVYENVEMRRYEGTDGHPYIHDTMTNGTDKGIVSSQYGMLAFDKDGKPLKIDWWSLDNETESTFFYLNETDTRILPGDTYDEHGGWSLNFYGTDSAVNRIAYVLYCTKEIVFEDGTVWINPDFETWRSAYEGRRTDIQSLKNYYPYVLKQPG